MLKVIADLQKNKVGDTLLKSLCFSVQIDGSMDWQKEDSKFVTARYIPPNEVSVQTVFVGVISDDEGILDALCNSLADIAPKTSQVDGENGDVMTKIMGITTDE